MNEEERKEFYEMFSTSPKKTYEQIVKTIQAVTNSQEKHIYYKFGDEYILYEKEMLLNYLKKEKQKALDELDRDTSKLNSLN